MRRRGPFDSLGATVGDVAGALRRRRENREPSVRLYDEQGQVQVLPFESTQARALTAAAEAMVDAVDAVR